MIVELTFENWGKYRGRHTIRLGAGAHGVVAMWDGDPRRSNGGGKSQYLESIGFLLYGIHRHATEDEWITNGEERGGVEGKIGPWTIKRERERGKSTQLEVRVEISSAAKAYGLADGGVSKGPDAQDVIDKQVVGMTRDEWVEACWLRQKEHAGMLVMKLADRMARVRQWCDLASLEKAHAEARRRLNEVDKLVESEKANADASQRAVDRAAQHAGYERFDADEVSAKLGFTKHAVEVTEKEAQAFVEEIQKHGGIRREIDDRVRKRAKVAQLRSEAEELDGTEGPPTDWVETATATHDQARQARTTPLSAKQDAQKLCQGTFDGQCPVNGRVCPVAGEIRADRVSARQKLEDASERLLVAEKAVSEARSKENDLRRTQKEAETASIRAAEARRLADRLEAEIQGEDPEDPPDDAELEEKASRARHKLAELRERASNLKAALEAGTRETERRDACLAVVAENTEKRRLLRLACQVLGRSGAQRVLAEDTVSQVEARANEALERAGIRNQVSLSWGKPTQKREPECPACGQTHPSTSKAAKCSRCGEERPFVRTDGLEIDVTDRGGAAEDLAGLTISLAAGAVVRHRRASPWDVVLVDEPFSALDTANSENLSKLMANLLGNFGFAQSFIVAHSKKVVDALPNHVVVEATDEGSTMRIE